MNSEIRQVFPESLYEAGRTDLSTYLQIKGYQSERNTVKLVFDNSILLLILLL